jgi:MFS family permease
MAVDVRRIVVRSWPARLPFYYGWINVAMGVLAMVATLPGRTWGLGLITEPLLKDLQLDPVEYARLNLWATLLGAAFCLPAGWLIDRLGTRTVFTGVALALGAVVVAMSRAETAEELFPLVTLTRGFGQSALTVVSLALVGKWFMRRVSRAMTAYMIFLILGFMVAERTLGSAVELAGWRQAWAGTGWVLVLGVAPLGWLLARSTPESCGVAPDLPPEDEPAGNTESSLSLGQALLTPLFWAFILAGALNSVTQAGISLFGVSLMIERGFDMDTYVNYLLLVSTFAALPGNLLAGWKAERWSLQRTTAVGLILLLVSLAAFPFVQSKFQVATAATVWGAAVGILGVTYSAIWVRAFGRASLGRIQGAATIFHVLSSASGPLLMALCMGWTGSYSPFFIVAAAAVAIMAVAIWFVQLPRRAIVHAAIPQPSPTGITARVPPQPDGIRLVSEEFSP